ncbi:MAG TPA: heavy metal translocating P-type ATPase, partial [Mycobacterium sp.]|nr:heavy metal translocating P-type ATPase [Mycobacterium sp.]
MTVTFPATAVEHGAKPKSSWLQWVWSVSSVRWAVCALVLFLAGLAAQIAGAPEIVWWTLYLACYATGGWAPAWEGVQALRARTLDVDLLMVVAALGAATIGQVFDGALLIVIFATSGALEDVATRRTEDSVRGLLDLAPDRAVVVDDNGGERVVDASSLRIGDEIAIRPGERIPADATVVDGSSDVDQSSITGEPLPVPKMVGDEVFAGTLNGSGALRAKVTRDPSQSVVARIVAMVAEASATKAKTQLFIEKVEQRYSAVVVMATVALFAVPLVLGADLQSTLLRAMTFMIVASPCAVVLATMPPLLSAIANASRHGVLVKSAVVMERLADTTTVAFDKTGTLTSGKPELSSVAPLNGFGETELLGLAAAAEQFSEHPLGHAVVAAARQRRIVVPHADGFRALPGRGVSATVAGRMVEVLSPAAYPHDPPDAVCDVESTGATAVIVTVDGLIAGVLGLQDRVRADAAAAVRRVAAITSQPPVLLTGDNSRSAAYLAERVGIGDVRAPLLPEHKVAAVQQLQAD